MRHLKGHRYYRSWIIEQRRLGHNDLMVPVLQPRYNFSHVFPAWKLSEELFDILNFQCTLLQAVLFDVILRGDECRGRIAYSCRYPGCGTLLAISNTLGAYHYPVAHLETFRRTAHRQNLRSMASPAQLTIWRRSYSSAEKEFVTSSPVWFHRRGTAQANARLQQSNIPYEPHIAPLDQPRYDRR